MYRRHNTGKLPAGRTITFFIGQLYTFASSIGWALYELATLLFRKRTISTLSPRLLGWALRRRASTNIDMAPNQH